MTEWLHTAFGTALAAALLLGLCCGTLGAFVVVRRMALTGDMLSHAVLPGIVAGLVWNTQRDPLVVLAAALLAGMAGSAVMHAIQRTTRLKPDAALGIVLSVFFAGGIAMISIHQPSGVQAYLYGQAAAIDQRDLRLLAGVTVLTLGVVGVLFRLLHVTAFDAGFSRLLGYPVQWLDRLFYFLLSASIVVAMQAVGVVLISAMLIAPAAAALKLSHRFGRVVTASCLIGAVSASSGVWISGVRTGLPTGPVMALAVCAAFALVSLFAPRDGILAHAWRHWKMRRRIARENLLKSIFRVMEEGGFRHDGVTLLELSKRDGRPVTVLARGVGRLVAGKDATWSDDRSGLLLTTTGRRRAEEIVRNHRLWERYLTERASYAADHVHEDAERVEHFIGEDEVRRLEETLDFPSLDPHGRPIPAVGKDGKGGLS
ncbi:metal ABC transporter permease [Luteolibacter ambystomatis]|uniref:Metal ABC transporter permease n=1 Tax=Luteolibacter ambystomatis TaxID=2824561 RepID=A0A975PGL1_9BACT|nr:iron chelate uptake ABC transporter family permease subunit [Luteolibacter ambystomatis]QUE52839.1 metal ABC transporter permease [Luteolibacter ambystomatis]